MISAKYDCCDKEMETRIYNSVASVDTKGSYYLSVRGVGIDICEKCVKKFIKNKTLNIK